MMRGVSALVLAAMGLPASGEPLTVRAGETWLFTLHAGDPAHARKIEPAASPASGEVKVSVRAFMGTMMTISNNSPQGYTFKAELIDAGGKAVTARTCTLPPGNQPALESWPKTAAAVRIGTFKPASGGRC